MSNPPADQFWAPGSFGHAFTAQARPKQREGEGDGGWAVGLAMIQQMWAEEAAAEPITVGELIDRIEEVYGPIEVRVIKAKP